MASPCLTCGSTRTSTSRFTCPKCGASVVQYVCHGCGGNAILNTPSKNGGKWSKHGCMSSKSRHSLKRRDTSIPMEEAFRVVFQEPFDDVFCTRCGRLLMPKRIRGNLYFACSECKLAYLIPGDDSSSAGKGAVDVAE